MLGILCAIWRAPLAQHRTILKTEARNTVAVHHQKEANREHEVKSSCRWHLLATRCWAVFEQTAEFTRGLGVSRLVQLVTTTATNSWWFALLLCVTQLLVAPLAFYAGRFIAPQLANPAQLRPVVYVACVAVVCMFEYLVLRAVTGSHGGQLLRILPLAAVNSGVLGTVLVERTQSFSRWSRAWASARAAAWATCWPSCWSRRRGTACAAEPSR